MLSICKSARPGFVRHIDGFRHEIKGMLNSEMLLFCALSRHLAVDAVIESGRARGNSTQLLAEYFATPPALPVFSVEYFRYTEDSLVALGRLARRYPHLELRFGDAFYLLPRLCDRYASSTVLIDGPKGKFALQLAARLLKNPAVRAVFIHDAHRDSDVRPAIDDLFPGAFASDDPAFVGAFESLDGPCWDVYRQWEGYRDWGPYVRGDRRMRSYGPTLAVILNEPEGIDREEEVARRFDLPPLPLNDRLVLRLRRNLRSIVPRASEIPCFFRYLGMGLRRR